MEMEWITPRNSGRPGTLPAAQALRKDGERLPVMQWPKSLVHLNHLLDPLPGMFVSLQLQLRAVHPIHKPVFYTVDGMVRVNECPQLIAGPAPGELPPPVTFQLVGEGMRFYVVEAQVIILRVLEVFSPLSPLFFYALFARLLPIFLQCFSHNSTFLLRRDARHLSHSHSGLVRSYLTGLVP